METERRTVETERRTGETERRTEETERTGVTLTDSTHSWLVHSSG